MVSKADRNRNTWHLSRAVPQIRAKGDPVRAGAKACGFHAMAKQRCRSLRSVARSAALSGHGFNIRSPSSAPRPRAVPVDVPNPASFRSSSFASHSCSNSISSATSGPRGPPAPREPPSPPPGLLPALEGRSAALGGRMCTGTEEAAEGSKSDAGEAGEILETAGLPACAAAAAIEVDSGRE